MAGHIVTLMRHVLSKKGEAVPSGEMALILERIQVVAKRIAVELGRASLAERLGYSGETNVQGEEQKKLDEWTNRTFVEAFERGGFPVCSLVSEEMDEALHFPQNCGSPSYAVLYDPLDGSSNTDVNGSLGTIFSVRKRAPGHGEAIDDLLKPGTQQVASGYVLYGPGTQLVYTAGAGVDIYTLDRDTGEFMLWREGLRMPPRGSAYAVNQGNAVKWHPGARKFIDHLTSRKDKSTSYSLRYTGAFVADFHRCLLEGGLYLYPGEAAAGGKSKGKLRLMYELAPLALIAEQAGGKASTGKARLLDVVPGDLHDRQPIYIGSAEEVDLAERMHVEE
jgi:fructose-1,6-bisphosphatase I